RGAAEDGLRATRLGVDAAARAARLARIGGGHLDKAAPQTTQLVAEHVSEAGPSRVGDAASAVTPDHPSNVQPFQHNDAVALGESCRLDVQEVVALPLHLAVDACDASLGLLSVLRSFLLARNVALSTSELLERPFEIARVGDHLAIGRRAEVRDASVDGDDGTVARSGLGQVQFADDTDEPLVPVALERAGLGLTLERPVHHGAQRAELGEADVTVVDAPHLRVRLAEGKRVAALALPARGASELLEASLPGLVELDEQLRADVAGNVREPRQLGAQLGQFFHLVECAWVDAFVAWYLRKGP